MSGSAISGKGFYGSNAAQATTKFWSMGGGAENFATETNTDVASPAGTFTQLAFNVVSTGFAGNVTDFRLRVNAGNSTLVASQGSGLTGWFADTTHSVTVVNNDLITLSSTGSGAPYTGNEGGGNVTFTPSSGGVVAWHFDFTSAVYSATSVNFSSLEGYYSTIWSGTEAATKTIRARVAGAYTNLQIDVSANTKSTGATAFTLRKNGADGNNTISIGASGTGSFSDTTHSDTIASGDDINVSATATVAGSVTPVCWGARFTSNSTDYDLYAGGRAASNGTSAGNIFGFAFGTGGVAAGAWEATEARTQQRWGSTNGKFSKMRVNLTANAAANALVITSRINGVDGNQTFSVPATNTGWFEDTTHSDNITTGDLIGLRSAATNNGNTTIAGQAITADLAFSTVTGTAVMSFGGIAFNAAGSPVKPTGTAIMSFGGIKFNSAGIVAHVKGTAIMSFAGISIAAAGLKPSGPGTGRRQFWTFGA